MVLEVPAQTLHNRSRKPRSFKDQAGVDLKQRRPGGHLFPGILGVEDAAYTHDGKASAGLTIQVTNHLRAASGQWASA
jgi:hypothetical protein